MLAWLLVITIVMLAAGVCVMKDVLVPDVKPVQQPATRTRVKMAAYVNWVKLLLLAVVNLDLMEIAAKLV